MFLLLLNLKRQTKNLKNQKFKKTKKKNIFFGRKNYLKTKSEKKDILLVLLVSDIGLWPEVPLSSPHRFIIQGSYSERYGLRRTDEHAENLVFNIGSSSDKGGSGLDPPSPFWLTSYVTSPLGYSSPCTKYCTKHCQTKLIAGH